MFDPHKQAAQIVLADNVVVVVCLDRTVDEAPKPLAFPVGNRPAE